MWVFLGSETLLFAGLFALYAGYRAQFPRAFALGVAHNEEWIGTTNTFVLIVSSFFVAWALHAVRGGRRIMAVSSLGAALFLGACFLGLKGLEYSEHLHKGIAPGSYYHYAELTMPGLQPFFTLYYFMTGLHALHVIAGMSLLAWLTWRVLRRRTTAERHVVLELSGLYWHLVDIVWIFLWPLLYLIH
jgi:cytochrome c oxidase subunit 3